MTNKDKYLKNNIKENDFADMCVYLTRYFDNKISMQEVAEFFKEQATPTLTEDERVILRNIQKGLFREGFISRTTGNELFVFIKETGETIELYIFNHLFQFIKERRRIRNS